MRGTSSVTFSLIFCLLQSHGSFSYKVEGDACNLQQDLCDDTLTFLTCYNDLVCRCADSKAYFEHSDKDGYGKCHLRVPEPCTSLNADTPCPINGYCNSLPSQNLCACNVGYYVSPTQKCAKFRGQSCVENFDCDRDKFFNCSGSYCECDPVTTIYNPLTDQCDLKLNQSCTEGESYQRCRPHAVCSDEGNGGQCLCGRDYADNGREECKVKVGSMCAVSDDCGDFAECTVIGLPVCKCLPQFEGVDFVDTNCHLTQKCPLDFQCPGHQFCNMTAGVCQNHLELGRPCADRLSCGNFTDCLDVWNDVKVCSCLSQYSPGDANVHCYLSAPCPSLFTCSNGTFCNDRLCETSRPLGAPCLSSVECGGARVSCMTQVQAGGQLDQKTCQCTGQFIPDRPIGNPNAVCVERSPEDGRQLECRQMDSAGSEWSAFPGEVKTRPCPGNQAGIVIWTCAWNGRFLGVEPNFKNCSSRVVADLEIQLELITINGTIDLDNGIIFMEDMTQVLNTALLTDDLTEENEGEFFGHEIQTMIDILNSIITHVTANDLSEGAEQFEKHTKVTGQVYKAVATFLRFKKPWGQLNNGERSGTFTSILDLMGTAGFQLVDRVPLDEEVTDPPEYYQSYHESTFFVTAGKSLTSEIQFPVDSQRRPGEDSFFEFQGEEGHSGQSFVGTEIGLDFVRTFVPPSVLHQQEVTIEKGKILNANLLSYATPTVESVKAENLNNGTKVLVTFLHDADTWGDSAKNISRSLHPGEKPRGVKGSTECVQWDESKGTWTTEGCELIETDTFYTQCACDPMSTYGVVNDFHVYQGKSMTEYGVSFVFYAGTIGWQIYKIYTSPSLHGDIQLSMRNYMNMFLAASNLLLIFFVDRHFFYLSEDWCYFIGFVSHWLILSSFMFLWIVGLNLFWRLAKIQNKKDSKFQKLTLKYKKWGYPIFCIGLPLLLVLVTVLVGQIGGKNSRVYGGDFCWLDGPFIWAFFGPTIVVISVNLIMTVIILWRVNTELNILLESESNEERKLSEDEEEDEKMIKELLDCRVSTLLNLSLSILLGVTWFLGYFRVGPNYVDSDIVKYSFPVLMAFQAGLMLILKEDVPMNAVVEKVTKTKTKSQRKKNSRNKKINLMNEEENGNSRHSHA